MIKNFLLFAVISSCTYTAFAQPDKIDTDRPDQTESAVTVPKKWMQLEMGLMREKESTGYGLKDLYLQHPTLLTRYGLGKRFELRLLTELATSKNEAVNGNFSKTGLSGIQLGGKVNFFDEKGIRPKTSLLAHYDFARLRTLYRDSIDGASFRISMQNTISKLISAGYNIGMEWERFDAPPAYIYTFSTGFNISEKWYSFIEVFGSVWKNESPENSIDAGISYNINDNFKIDLSGGIGISKNAADNFYAIGASYRFKTRK
jgi:hypothetical protein